MSSIAQSTLYSPLYNSGNFTKTINLSKPVGETPGSANVVGNGGIAYSIPVFTPPGTNNLQPSVSLNYSSQSGPGVAGYGWNISGVSVISRGGKNIYHNGEVTPINFTAVDDAFLLDGMRLNVISGINGANGTIYAGEAETYSRIESFTSGSPDNPNWFKVTAKDGTIMEFGNTSDSRFLTDDGVNTLFWRLNKILDINGNYIEFKYLNTDRHTRLSQILYTGNASQGLLPYNQINFSYTVKTDQNAMYEAGSTINTKYLLDQVAIVHTNDASIVQTIKTYKLNYGFNNIHSFLKEVVEYGGDMTAASLNSTIFLYGDQPQNLNSVVSNMQTGPNDIFVGDFDADGKSDIVAAEKNFDQNVGMFIHSKYQVRTGMGQYGYSTYYEKTLDPGTVIQYFYTGDRLNFMVSDYNGDGRDDVMEVGVMGGYGVNGTKNAVTRLKINYTNSNTANNYSSSSFLVPWTTSSPFNYFAEYNEIYDSDSPFYIPGDFDGDGNKEFILILGGRISSAGNNHTRHYKAFLTNPSKNISNSIISNFGFGANPMPSNYAETVAAADKLNVIDIDGDGRMEIIVTKDQQSHIISITPTYASGTYTYTASVLFSTGVITKDSRYYPGDFNGDRKTDFLLRSSNGNWNIYYSKGNSLVTMPFVFNQTVLFTNSEIDNNHKLIIADYNGDGYNDILHGYNYWDQSTLKSKLSLYYSRGNGGTQASTFFYEQYNYDQSLGQDVFVGDFDGDGKSDLLNRQNIFTNGGHFVTIKPNGQEYLLKKVTTGHNVTTSFDYKLLTDVGSSPAFYYRTTSLDDSSNANPYNSVRLPMYAISSMTMPDGAGGNNTTEYFYEDAVLHRAGKGLLGFKKITSKNNVSGITTVVENDINLQFATPYQKRQSTYLTAGNILLTRTDNFYTFQNLSTGPGDIRYFVKTDKTETTDYLNDGRATHSQNLYDNYGNVTSNTTQTGFMSGTYFFPVETAITSTGFIAQNTPVPSLPSYITISSARTGSNWAVNSRTYTYAPSGLVASETNFQGMPKAVTNTYTYNGFGNLLTTTTSATGVPTIVSTDTYDAKGRYSLQKQQATGTAIAQTQTVTMDSRWSKMLTNVSSDCLTTSSQYDGFGKLLQTTLPDGNIITTTETWQVNGDALFYTTTSATGGSPDTKIYYDKFGREFKKEKESLSTQSSNWHTVLTSYNSKGAIASKTNSFFPATETARVTSFQYDVYGRAAGQTNYAGNITVSYSPEGNGNVKQISVDQAGRTSEKITDATGKIISAKDNGGELTYFYDSKGNQVEVRQGATTIVNTGFDDYGNQVILVDIDAGTTTYDYDAYGRMTQQQDANGNITTMAYDELNRPVSKNITEGTISYTYYKNQLTGCINNNLTQITNFNGIIRTYRYDALARLTRVTQSGTSDGTTHITNYAYNAYGKLLSTTYPSGVTEHSIYDGNGYLTGKSASGTGLAGLTSLYYNPVMDGEGRILSYTLGNGKTTSKTYSNDFPLSSVTPGVQNLTYNFQTNTGNLLQRSDILAGQSEVFAYDNLDRLTGSTVNNSIQFATTYDGTTGNSMGNIDTKTDAGYYKYRSDKKHAIAHVTATPVLGQPAVTPTPVSVISQDEQVITYTSFLKTASINEGSAIYGGGASLNFEYGPDYERVITRGGFGRNQQLRYFDGNYEEVQRNTDPFRNIHYISGADGLCAMLVTENGVTTPYYMYTDYLDNILTATNTAGTIVATQNFDAWGRHRNPSNWNQFGDFGIAQDWLYRGFTGHEMLPFFTLINMNGRMYDPILGRMLSPDNHVSTPYSTQGYNRYSYALNNPLKFTDPNGNDPITAIVVGAIIGGFFKGIQYDISGKGSFFDGFWRGALVGGLGGYASTIAPIGFLPGLGYGTGTGAILGGLSAALDGGSIGKGALTGGILGGVAGALMGGIEAKQLGGNFWTGKRPDQYVTEAEVAAVMGPMQGTAAPYNDEYLNELYNKNYPGTKGLVGMTMKLRPKNYQVAADGTWYNVKTKGIYAITQRKVWFHGKSWSSVYFSQAAFKSKEVLAFTMAHELGHVTHNYTDPLRKLAGDYIPGMSGQLDNEGHYAIQKMTYNLVRENGWNVAKVGIAGLQTTDLLGISRADDLLYNPIIFLIKKIIYPK